MKVAGLVYARWCPHCHSLMPHFVREEIWKDRFQHIRPHRWICPPSAIANRSIRC